MNHLRRTCIALLFVFLLVSCSSNSSEQDDSQSNPIVEYGSDVSGENDLAKYTNADWLYQNYFGEYGLPEELKIMMMPELQMMANGFALQHSRGEDVERSISELNTAIKMLRYSGELSTSLAQMMEEHNTGLYDVPEVHTRNAENELVERVIDEEAKANIAQSDQLEAEYIREQEELVKNHSLPYPLPGRTTKYFVYSQGMKGGGFKPTEDVALGPDLKPLKPRKHKNLHLWNWWEADFIWTNGAGGIGHVGIIDIRFTHSGSLTPDIIDANPGVGVKTRTELDQWANDGGWTRLEGWYYSELPIC